MQAWLHNKQDSSLRGAGLDILIVEGVRNATMGGAQHLCVTCDFENLLFHFHLVLHLLAPTFTDNRNIYVHGLVLK